MIATTSTTPVIDDGKSAIVANKFENKYDIAVPPIEPIIKTLNAVDHERSRFVRSASHLLKWSMDICILFLEFLNSKLQTLTCIGAACVVVLFRCSSEKQRSGRLPLDDVHQPTAHRQPKHLELVSASIHRTSISGCSSFRQPLSIICGLR